jgi:hypothetical protein
MSCSTESTVDLCGRWCSGSGEPAAPRRQSLLRSQARYALIPAATPRATCCPRMSAPSLAVSARSPQQSGGASVGLPSNLRGYIKARPVMVRDHFPSGRTSVTISRPHNQSSWRLLELAWRVHRVDRRWPRGLTPLPNETSRMPRGQAIPRPGEVILNKSTVEHEGVRACG